ncbi:hypothetical protein ASG52_19720 [Methylobacterium sp. Leaf456]|uniref:hypothetical protein n=1 Tax=Methylobacterium sp. Leaf456 TaxID=1736382 RepID=UPI0006F1C72A|nr:hypothetical protein [Methylobacterium sp. Leaf456]KQT59956.1 hypothetical protein ASG52_19720 [Methylobacterium sp. Leaf456]
MSSIVRACALLIDAMNHDEREAVAAHLASQRAAPLPLASDLLRFVGGLFSPGADLRVGDIVAAAQERDPTVTQKQVYNALGYLTRRHAIRRLKQGRYAAATAQPATTEAPASADASTQEGQTR